MCACVINYHVVYSVCIICEKSITITAHNILDQIQSDSVTPANHAEIVVVLISNRTLGWKPYSKCVFDYNHVLVGP